MRVSVPVGQQKTERRYVYLVPGHGELYWSYVARGVRNADEEGGSWTLLERYIEESKAISCMENAILADVDGIIMKSSRQAEEQIEMAHQADIPVIFLTGIDGVQMELESYVNGAADFIQKPVNADLLRLKIKRQLFVRDLKIQNHLLQEKLQQVKTRIDSIFDEIM